MWEGENLNNLNKLLGEFDVDKIDNSNTDVSCHQEVVS